MRHQRRLRIAHNQAELLVIELLREAAQDGTRKASPYAELAETARQHGLMILDRRAPCLSLDEIALLACLASRQRKKPICDHIVARYLADPLQKCVEDLEARSLRLPYRTIQRLGFVRRDQLALNGV